MSKLKNYVCANLPDLSPSQAAIIIATLEAVTQTLWNHYGDSILATSYLPKPPPQPLPYNAATEDLEPFF